MSTSRDQTIRELAVALDSITATRPIAAPVEAEVSGSFGPASADIVRPAHAIDALRHPDDLVTFEYQDFHVVIATRAVTTANGAFVLMVLVYERQDKLFVESAFRLYLPTDEARASASDAKHTFLAFLERNAIPYESAGRRVLFIPIHRFAASPTLDIAQAFGLQPQDGPNFIFSGSVRHNDDESWTFAWPFLVNADEYYRDITEHQR